MYCIFMKSTYINMNMNICKGILDSQALHHGVVHYSGFCSEQVQPISDNMYYIMNLFWRNINSSDAWNGQKNYKSFRNSAAASKIYV